MPQEHDHQVQQRRAEMHSRRVRAEVRQMRATARPQRQCLRRRQPMHRGRHVRCGQLQRWREDLQVPAQRRLSERRRRSCNADDDGCTVGDTCRKGVCKAGPKKVCTGQTAVCEVPKCVSQGASDCKCLAAPAPDGTGCDDAGACQTGGTCKAGSCVGGSQENGEIVVSGAREVSSKKQPWLASWDGSGKLLWQRVYATAGAAKRARPNHRSCSSQMRRPARCVGKR